MSAGPTSDEGPGTSCQTSAGRPAAIASLRMNTEVSVVVESGLWTTALPAVRAANRSVAPRVSG